jgi:hypothetical protein
VGDIPLGDTTFTVNDDEGNDVELVGIVGAQASVYSPAGLDLTDSLPVSHTTTDLTVTWPETSFLATPGLYSLRVTLDSATGSVQLAPLTFVVEARDGWHTLASARNDWKDAPAQDGQLYGLLAVAREQCEEYAPALAVGTEVPSRFRLAQLMQARNLWNSTKTDPSTGGYGAEGFVIRPYPMDGVVKNILRPKRAVPVIA